MPQPSPITTRLQAAPRFFLQADALSFLQIDGHADFLMIGGEGRIINDKRTVPAKIF
jgi:hypothetical protein